MPEIASTTFSQTDASNTSPLPGLDGTTNPNQIDNSVRALMGAIKREHVWRNGFTATTGSANAYVLAFTVAPDAYYPSQTFSFTANFTNTGSATLNVNSLGAKTIKKDVAGVMTVLSSGDIATGQKVIVNNDGTDFIWVNWQGAAATISSATTSAEGVVELLTTTELLTGTDPTRAATADSIAAMWEQGSDIASAGTISVGEGGYFNVTGTTTITDIDFGTDKAGRKVWLRFSGVLTLTHNATSLILPGGANITTAAGDTACFVSEGSDNVRCLSYNKASGAAVVVASAGLTLATPQTPSGVANADFTSIPSGVKQINVMFSGVSFNGNATPRIQLGDSGGIETTGYTSSAVKLLSGGTPTVESSDSTTGVALSGNSMGGSDTMYGLVIFSLLNESSNLWVASGNIVIATSTADRIEVVAGSKALSSVLTQVRVSSSGGELFDAGTVNISHM